MTEELFNDLDQILLTTQETRENTIIIQKQLETLVDLFQPKENEGDAPKLGEVLGKMVSILGEIMQGIVETKIENEKLFMQLFKKLGISYNEELTGQNNVEFSQDRS